VGVLARAKGAVTIRARKRPDRAASHREMARAGLEALSEETNLFADGYGLVTEEKCGRGENGLRINGSEFPGSRVALSHYRTIIDGAS
jgi:hypothetical protein